jgi:hypothetical protein
MRLEVPAAGVTPGRWGCSFLLWRQQGHGLQNLKRIILDFTQTSRIRKK